MKLKDAMATARFAAYLQAIQWSRGNVSAAALALGVQRTHAHKAIGEQGLTGHLYSIRCHPTATKQPSRPAPLEETMAAANRAAYKAALEFAGGDVAAAAEVLDVAPTSVYEALTRLDLISWLREIRESSGWVDRSMGEVGVPRGPGERARAI